jgi:diguanylate cyclase (GGDEF)-like protein
VTFVTITSRLLRRSTPLLCLLLLWPVAGVAGDSVQRRWTAYANPAPFEHVSVEHGLSQSTVRWILQDKQGFLWFGTDSGLDRYDGNGFRVFKPDIESPDTSLGDGRVNSLLQDHRGLIWISTNGGLSGLDPSTLAMRTYRGGQTPGELSSSIIQSIVEDRWGNIWIGTLDKGLCMLPETWKPGEAPRFRCFPADGQNPLGPASGRIDVLFIDSRDQLWIGSQVEGLARSVLYDRGEPSRFEYFPPDPNRPDTSPPSRINAILEDSFGVIWVGTYVGLFSFDPEDRGFHRYTSNPADPASLASSIVRRLNRDREGTLWVCNEGGLSRMLPRQRRDDPPRFQRYQHDPKDPRSLSSNGIQFALEDTSGILWVSAFQAGLNKMILNPNRIRARDQARDQARLHQYRNNAADPTSLTGDLVSAIGEDRYGNLWIGTDGSGLNRVIPPANRDQPLRFERFRAEAGKPGALPGDVIVAIHRDSRGRLWLGTYMSGLLRVDQDSPTGKPRFTQWKHDDKDPETLASDFILSILDDGQGRLWIATGEAGLNRFDPETGKVKRFALGGNGRPAMRIHPEIDALALDTFGTLWMATPDGLNRFNPVTEECRSYVPGAPGAISAANVQTIQVDDLGTLWIGSDGGGLNKAVIPPWDGPAPAFKTYDTKHGLPSMVVKGIRADKQGQLWLSMDRTICRFDPKEERAHPFVFDRDLQRCEFVKNSCFRDASGELFFGSNDGLTFFHPEDIVRNPVAPPIVMTDFQVLNKPMLQSRWITNKGAPEITLYPRDTSFSFDFAALHFVAPEQNQYAFLMEGLDQSWKESPNKHSISYTTLPPGHYTLRAKASNCDGIWGKEEFRLKIHVLAPWYKTGWFEGLLVVSLLGTVYLTIRLRLKVLRARNRLLEETVLKRTGELRAANEELENLSLTDPLTGLKNRRFLHSCMPKDIAQVMRAHRNQVRGDLRRASLNIDVLIIMVDIDLFKSINDHHGHYAGDMVLQQVASILQRSTRESDIVARWGGEEFLVVARNAARADATILPERIRSAMEAHPFDVGAAEPIRCTCSLGLSVFPLSPGEPDRFTWEQIVEIADACLFAAKHSGRNAWVGIIPGSDCCLERHDHEPVKKLIEQVKLSRVPFVSSLAGPIVW